MSDFDNAIALMDGLYDAAALHMLYENDLKFGQRNIYASLTYARSADVSSIPTTVEVAGYGRFTALRKRLNRAQAQSFIDAARTGSASVDSYTVAFNLDETTHGFRPGCAVEPPMQRSPFQISMWTREHIGGDKRLDGIDLSRASVWSIKDRLHFLDEARWSAIIVARSPEKIGDLDEWWPTPLEVASVSLGGNLRVTFPRNTLSTNLYNDIRVSGEIYANGLEVAHVIFEGAGPHAPRVVDAEGSRLTLTVGDITLDRQIEFYVRSILLNMQLTSNQTWDIPARGARPAFSLPVGATAVQSIAGQAQQVSTRAEAWRIGDYARTLPLLSDAEFVYDPAANANHAAQALSDLRTLYLSVHRPRVRIIDPYVLDEPAMEMVAAIVSRSTGASCIELFCSFERPPRSAASSNAQGTLVVTDRSSASAVIPAGTARQREQDRARRVAESIKSRLGVSTLCYSVTRVHDRFLMIDDRLWHVGPSFNHIGLDFSAIVEMRDPRRVADVVAFMDRNATVANEMFST